LVGFVHITPREPVVGGPRVANHATVHHRLRTPRKCEAYCEREVDDIEWMGHRVYLHLGLRRDHRREQDTG
jgi:hypothetical protein